MRKNMNFSGWLDPSARLVCLLWNFLQERQKCLSVGGLGYGELHSCRLLLRRRFFFLQERQKFLPVGGPGYSELHP